MRTNYSRSVARFTPLVYADGTSTKEGQHHCGIVIVLGSNIEYDWSFDKAYRFKSPMVSDNRPQ